MDVRSAPSTAVTDDRRTSLVRTMTSQLICPAVKTRGDVLHTMDWLETCPGESGLVDDDGGL